MRWIIFYLIFATEICWAGKITKRKIELEWEQQANATYYEVEIYDSTGTKLLKTQKISEPTYKSTLAIGNYKFRSRYGIQTGEVSPWSELELLDVTVPVGSLQSENISNFHQVDLKTKSASVPFNWNMIAGIKEYKLNIVNKSGKAVYAGKVTASPFRLSLPEGEYQFSVTPIDEYGNTGEASALSDPITVSKAKLPPPVLSFQDEENKESPVSQTEGSGAGGQTEVDKMVDNFKSLSWKGFAGSELEGRLFYRRIFATEWVEVELKEKINKSPWTPPNTLSPGEYQLMVRSRVADAEPSDPRYFFFRKKPRREHLSEFLSELP